LKGESESRNRMPFVNLKNDLPVFGIKHDGCEVRALRDTHRSRSALQGVAFAPRFTKKRRHLAPNTLGDVWAIASKLLHGAQSFGNARFYNCHEKVWQRLIEKRLDRDLCKPLHIDQRAHFAPISHPRESCCQRLELD
jgi:hypothetical protein